MSNAPLWHSTNLILGSFFNVDFRLYIGIPEAHAQPDEMNRPSQMRRQQVQRAS
jgi:hypothetical protein